MNHQLSKIRELQKRMWSLPGKAGLVLLFAWLSAAPSFGQDSDEQKTGQDKDFPVETNPEKLPDGAIMRIGQYGDRTSYNGVYKIRFSPNGELLALLARDQIVRVFNLDAGEKIAEVDGHDYRVTGLAFSPDSKFFATSGFGDKDKLIIWHSESGEQYKEFAYGAEDITFSKDGKFLYVMRTNRLDRIHIESGNTTKLISWPRTEQGIGIADDGSMVATKTQQRSRYNQVYLYDIQSPKKKRSFVGLSAMVSRASISPNHRWLMARYQLQKKPILWELNQPKKRMVALDVHENACLATAFSKDNRFIATTAQQGGAYLWDSVTQSSIKKLEGHDKASNIVGASFSPNGLYLATGASGRKDSSLILWDVRKLVFGELESLDRELTNDEANSIWEDLAEKNSKKGLAAVAQFVRSKKQLVARYSTKLGETTNDVDDKNIIKLISLLDNEKFSVRNDAMEKLMKMRNAAEKLLRIALKNNPTVEKRYRISKILEMPVNRPKISDADYRRLLRSIYALEMIGNDKAIDILKSLSQGHPHFDISGEAASALVRIELLKSSESE